MHILKISRVQYQIYKYIYKERVREGECTVNRIINIDTVEVVVVVVFATKTTV